MTTKVLASNLGNTAMSSGISNPIAIVWNACTDLGTRAGPITIDLSLGNVYKLVLGGNVTLSFINTPGGQPNPIFDTFIIINFLISQSAPGNFIITWPTGFKWQSAVPIPVSAGVGLIDAYNIASYDGGTTWLVMSVLKGLS